MNRRDSFRILAASAAALPVVAAEVPEGLPTRAIPSSGEKIPRIGFCSSPNTGELPPATTEESLKAYVSMGSKVLAVSPRHEGADEVFGGLIGKLNLRDKLFLSGMVRARGKEDGIAAMKTTMKNLGAERMDLFLVSDLIDAKVHLDTLRGWKKDGLVKYIGIQQTILGPQFLEETCKVAQSEVLDFIQIDYSLSSHFADRKLLPLATDKGIAVLASFPLGGGESAQNAEKRPLPDWAVELRCKSWRQLFLKFTLSHPAITCALITRLPLPLIREVMEAAQGPLPDEKMRERILKEVEG